MDHIVTLDSRQESRPPGHRRQVHCQHKGDPVKALKEMIARNGHLQDRLDALTLQRRATR
ncbi:MAG: hypothetical protein E5X07_23035 [Mesorhizobium sp.]|uniref:hypothetical protein n=1 Tax=Mesorhizobium sp. TaxID=1871066 RepID=UPI001219B8BE|nr:hypothetical protein [Mesorhizobium sp.]TIR30124.1 MAG: hypothetical protein E5X35_23950 [Mesorhizobium sp.]TIS21239.1 MAG: hypothetical protein E5X07_23035 [Mesorhizobium sp.]